MSFEDWTGKFDEPMLKRWDRRHAYALRFREIIQLLEELDCPLAHEVGLCHLRWFKTPTEQVASININPGNPETFSFRIGARTDKKRYSYEPKPDQLREVTALFVAGLKERLK